MLNNAGKGENERTNELKIEIDDLRVNQEKIKRVAEELDAILIAKALPLAVFSFATKRKTRSS